MNFLIFNPEHYIEIHATVMDCVATELQAQGHSIYKVFCTKGLTRCVVRDSIYSGDNEEERWVNIKDQVCRNCQLKAKIVNKSDSHLISIFDAKLRMSLSESLRTKVNLAISGVSPLDELYFEGFPLGLVARSGYHLISRKSHLDFSIPSEKRHIEDLVYDSLRIYFEIKDIISRYSIDKLLFMGNYSQNLSAVFSANSLGVEALSVTNAQHDGFRRDLIRVDNPVDFEISLHSGYLRKCWNLYKKIELNKQDLDECLRDSCKRLNPSAESFHVYSSGLKFSQTEIFDRLDIDPASKVIVYYLSSDDELSSKRDRFLAYGFELARYHSSPLGDQFSAIRFLCDCIKEQNSNICLVIRPHPRDWPNKRNAVGSDHATRVSKELQLVCDSHSFVRVLMPSNVVGSYDLLAIADAVAINWTTVGLEAARLGIPVICFYPVNLYYPEEVFFYGETIDEYKEIVAKLLVEDNDIEVFKKTICALKWYLFLERDLYFKSDVVTDRLLTTNPSKLESKGKNLFRSIRAVGLNPFERSVGYLNQINDEISKNDGSQRAFCISYLREVLSIFQQRECPEGKHVQRLMRMINNFSHD